MEGDYTKEDILGDVNHRWTYWRLDTTMTISLITVGIHIDTQSYNFIPESEGPGPHIQLLT